MWSGLGLRNSATLIAIFWAHLVPVITPHLAAAVRHDAHVAREQLHQCIEIACWAFLTSATSSMLRL